MANHSQHQQGNSASKCSGAGQAIVELCAASEGGLTFWSRQRFDIGAELQIRVRRDAIPSLHHEKMEVSEWITVRGFVVACSAMRKPNGEHGFQVSLLLESALNSQCQKHKPRVMGSAVACPKMKPRFAWLKRGGLN